MKGGNVKKMEFWEKIRETNGRTCHSGPAGRVSQMFILALQPTQLRS